MDKRWPRARAWSSSSEVCVPGRRLLPAARQHDVAALEQRALREEELGEQNVVGGERGDLLALGLRQPVLKVDQVLGRGETDVVARLLVAHVLLGELARHARCLDAA